MKAAVLHGVHDCRLEDVPIPTRKGEDEVLVRIRSCGVCGSDVHYYTHGRIGDFVVEGPMILGHECAGEVVEVGAEATGLQPGERVAIEPGWPCRKCAFCKQGKYNLCPEVEFYATPPYDGALAEYVRAPADFCYKLPDNVSTDAGAMVEPLATGLQAVKRGGVRPASISLVEPTLEDVFIAAMQ
jgi:L-iditol 2-dehydrogenase